MTLQICTSILHLVILLQAIDLDLLHQVFLERSQVIAVHFDRFRTSPQDSSSALTGMYYINNEGGLLHNMKAHHQTNFTFLNESYLPLWAILTKFTIFHFLCCVPNTIDGKQIVPILNLQWKIATVNVKLSRIYISIDFMHQKLQILMIKPCCFNSFLNLARKILWMFFAFSI